VLISTLYSDTEMLANIRRDQTWMEEAGESLVTIFSDEEEVGKHPGDMKSLETSFRDILGILQGQNDMTCDSRPGMVDLSQTMTKYVSVLPPPLLLQRPPKQSSQQPSKQPPWEYTSVF
jgi:hypothetical protein